jgi:phage gp36-like protein
MMPETYCEAHELLTGDIGGLEDLKQTFLVMATEEMDGMIGFVYVLPLQGVSVHAALILKSICRKLASGWLLMSQSAGSEDTSVHAYGKSLVDEAYRDLWAIRNGQIDLGVPKITTASAGDAPSIIQGDLTSAVDAYYAWQNLPVDYPALLGPIWRPGPDG